MENVTVDDLRTLARNLQAESQTSRAEMVYRTAIQFGLMNNEIAQLRLQVEYGKRLEKATRKLDRAVTPTEEGIAILELRAILAEK